MATLLQELFREYGTQQGETLRLRVRAMGGHAVPLLLPSLKAAEQTERIWAIKLLGDIGDESALPTLQQRLHASSLESLERVYYIEAIARFADTETIKTLQNLRNDHDPKVRRIVERALARLETTLKTVPTNTHNSNINSPFPLPHTVSPSANPVDSYESYESHSYSLTDAEFLSQFETATLPKKQWTHEAHIRMAYLSLRQTPHIDTLLPQVRARIIAYNQAQGNYKGYHETMTVAFLRIVKHRMNATNATNATNAINTESFEAFKKANKGIFQSTYLLRHYSEAILFSPEARQNFLTPDREPLP
jgi:hypothetical protein